MVTSAPRRAVSSGSARARHRHQRVGADVERQLKALARRVDEPPLEILARREGERVDDGVEAVAPPFASSVAKTASICASSVTSQGSTRSTPIDSASGRTPLLDRLVRVGQRQLGALGVEALGDRPGDAVIVGDAEDRGALAGHGGHGALEFFGWSGT